MMIVIAIILAVLFAIATAFILADVLRVPSYASSKAMNNLGQKQNKKTNPVEIFCREISVRLAGKLKLNEYRRLQLEIDLNSADMKESPEQYTANAVVKACLIGVFAIPFLFFAPIVSVLIAIISVVLYFLEIGKVSQKIKEKRRKIEYELPRLVANIEKSLYHSRDVVGILEAYRDIAGDELKRELEITIADMRTGNYEVALTRLEARVGSGMLSDITRGLIGVIRGDETGVYWGTLAIKFADYQRQALKREASKVPKKVRRLSMVLLVCFLLVYVVVIGSVLLESLGGLLA